MKAPICPYCGRLAKLVTGKIIYPQRPDLHHKYLWRCDPCDAHIGCHSFNGDHTPLGRLANAKLRRAKQDAHAAFDPMWKKGRMSRGAAYEWLAERMGLPEKECHIGMLDVEQCRKVVQIMKEKNNG